MATDSNLHSSEAGAIPVPSVHVHSLAEARQAMLLKPPGSLGTLEHLACWFAARQGRVIPRQAVPAITVFAADHGVARHGVSAYPSSVTAQMLNSLATGVAAVSVLARAIDAVLTIVDIGVASDSAPPPGVYNERIARGTCDFTQQPAMSLAQVRQALDIGAHHARSVIARGCNLLIAGEVGIGNTTAAAGLAAAALQRDADELVGHGTGIDARQREHKVAVVRQALARERLGAGPLSLLADLGGFEIAAMTGFYLEAARAGTPCVLDGFISTTAALIGCRIDERLRAWLLASHLSVEPGHALVLADLGLRPLLDCGLRLGEGSGAALVVPLIQAAIRLHAEMATFEEAGVDKAT